MLTDRIIGVLGAGNMGEALIAGLVKACIVEPAHVIASRRSRDALASLAEAYRAVGRDAEAHALEERIRP